MNSNPQHTAASRKEDHINLALAQQNSAVRHSDFDDLEFIHHALSGRNIESVDLKTEVAGKTWQHPLYINAMTGGTDSALRINTALAEAAAATGTAIATGSVGIALDQPETAATFKVLRERNPHGFVFSNIGAGRSVDDARRAVDLLEADALQIHVNAVQETVMPEGERRFETWLPLIAEIVQAVPVPVVVKEVGFGLSRRTLKQLGEIGVQIADVSGTGGTNFALIEAARRPEGYDDLLSYGQSAIVSLLDAPQFDTLLASGGVRTAMDAVKLLALGARSVGIAGAILKEAVDGDSERVVSALNWWITRIREISALLGAATCAELQHTDVLIRGRVKEYCQLRGVDPAGFASRSSERANSERLR
ncbi:type 2 isopentenyl-diphosphate Delta-isomerase [Canibacter zhoujuaniae]|uniref:type 2 isopentenyl-diphosphate Delta-isomerase n=1 Tax=Canibacter zhoujuaniae TaxID=2708343 RepID=UPI00141EAE14|nr:type 2 isopentenyl-diphosphate Delta-isomerase [Canibacter zhoujuaniae]